jgi:tetratricopeptide (TPR) repeat protein
MATLEERFTDALSGSGHLVLIDGPAGIGKTTLARGIGKHGAAAGGLVLIGACHELAQTPPYGPWIELFDRYPNAADLPELPAVVAHCGTQGEPTSQAGLFAEVVGFLREVSARRVLVLILEDLHWTDAASLDLLWALVRRLDQFRMLVLATYRDDEPSSGLLAPVLPSLVREADATRLSLRPLDDATIHQLVDNRYRLDGVDAARLVDYLHTWSSGNPLFIGELLRALEEEGRLRRRDQTWLLDSLGTASVPGLLRQLIHSRVARLGESERQLLAIAAVIGDEVALELWSTVAEVDPERLLELVDRAVQAHILETTADGIAVRFAHALIRLTLYEGVLAPRRRAWHARVASCLARLPNPDPDQLAHHYRQAADNRAAEWLVRAGQRAERAYAWLTAADRYVAAEALLERSGGSAAERGWLSYRIGAMRRFADPRAALVALDKAARLGLEASDDVLIAFAVSDGGMLRCFIGELRQGITEQQAGVAILDRLEATSRESSGTNVPLPQREQHPRGTLAIWLAQVGRYVEARDTVRPLLSSSASLESAVSLTQTNTRYAAAYLAYGWAQAAQAYPEPAKRALDAARTLYRALQHWVLLGWTTSVQLRFVVLPYAAERVDERQALAVEGADAWSRASGAQSDLVPELSYLPLMVIEGRWDECTRLASAALGVADAGGATSRWRLYLRAVLAQVAQARGDTTLAWRIIGEALPSGAATEPGDLPHADVLALQRVAAALACDAGELETARAWLLAHERWRHWGGEPLGHAEEELVWACFYRASGDIELAVRHASAALKIGAAPRQPLALLMAHRLLGELETMRRRFGEARDQLQLALGLAEACAAQYDRALVQLALAELAAARGEVPPPLTLQKARGSFE